LVLGLIFLFANFLPLEAAVSKAVSKPYQVKLANSPVIYFLHYGSHHKKAYLNSTSYLSYNNKWSDVKVISAKELATWPDMNLMKTGSSPAVYYIKGSKKAKLLSRDDLERFGFLGEPVLNISDVDLAQYKSVSYQEIGLLPNDTKSDSASSEPASTTDSSNSSNPPAATATSTTPAVVLGNLNVSNDLIKVTDNTLITNTKDNLMGVFRFQATQNTATITSITFSFTGLFNSALLSNATAKDENNTSYRITTNVRPTERQITINFRDPLTIDPGSEKTVKVYVDFKSCECNNQNVRLELKKASDIVTNLTPNASWPLQGTVFKMMVADNLLGNLTIQKETLAGLTSTGNSGRLLAKFTLGETTGREDVVIKKIVFKNNGSASKHDLTAFSLSNNNQMISRVAEFDIDHNIVFNLSYLRVSRNSATTLTIKSDLKTDYDKKATVDLQATEVSGTGQGYNLSIPLKINNFNEILTLN
jgi:hypothetical protein